MTRFQPNLAQAHAGFPMLDRGEYEFTITKATPFYRVKDDGSENGGCRCSLRVTGKVDSDGSLSEDFEGVNEMVAPITLWIHTPKAFGMTKQFIMAALGYPIKDEKRANEEYFEDSDFSVDVDDEENTIGGASWDDLVGKSLRMTADIGVWNGNDQQEYRSYQPLV